MPIRQFFGCYTMPDRKILTPALCRAARGLLDWTQDELAARSGLSRSTVRGFEKGHHELQHSSEQAIVDVFSNQGVSLILSGPASPGLSLKRQL